MLAPVVAIVLEELAPVGVETIVGTGTAGALADALHPGDVAVCSAALRDEGTSHHYALRSEGILTVDVEAAALFTVAGALGLRAASVFCISDTLHGSEWEPQFHAADIGDRLWSLFKMIESMLHRPACSRGLGLEELVGPEASHLR